MLEKIEEWIGEESILKILGYDDAVVGYNEDYNLLVYSKRKIGDLIEDRLDIKNLDSYTFLQEYNKEMDRLNNDFFSARAALLLTDDF